MSGGPIHTDQVIRLTGRRPTALLFRVSVTREAGWDRLTVEGELDLAAAPILQAEFDRLERIRGNPILLDLRRLSFMDVTGLRVMLAAHERALRNGSRLAIVRGPRAVHRVFELTGVGHMLQMVEDPDRTRPQRLPRASRARAHQPWRERPQSGPNTEGSTSNGRLP